MWGDKVVECLLVVARGEESVEVLRRRRWGGTRLSSSVMGCRR